MSKDPEFLILKPQSGWLPAADWEKLLGASVRNHLDPGRDFAPKNVKKYRTAKPAETKFEDFILQTEISNSGSFQLEVKGLGKLRWEKSAGSQIDLRGKVIYIKRLQHQGTYWKSVMKNREFREETAEWINEAKKQDKWWSQGKRPVCMIVGVLLCEDVHICVDLKEEEKRRDKGEVPLGTVAEIVSMSQGVPLSTGDVGNISADSSRTKVNRAYFKAEGKETYLCGIELRIIAIKKGKDGENDTLELKDNAPKAERGRTLGHEEEEEDIDPDSLPLEGRLEDVREEDWEVLLRPRPEESGE